MLDILTTQCENFTMKERESIHDMYTIFSSIVNKRRCLGKLIHPRKQVRKILRILPMSWASKVGSITEAKDLMVLTIKALIGNLQTYELNKTNGFANKDKSLALKVTQS